MRRFSFLIFALILMSSLSPESPSVAQELTSLSFPDGFRWCVATAAHQIEGGNTNSDWWEWEKIPGNIKNNEHSGRACEHWNLFPHDIALMKDLHVNQYRFSIEWAKIEPKAGIWDYAALEHYRREIAMLKKNGIEPFVTLHHFTLPRWFAEKGGWSRVGASTDFLRYAQFISRHFGGLVNDWVTFNEPMVHLGGGYVLGVTPPQKKDIRQLSGPLTELLRAHALVYKQLHADAMKRNQRIRVGFAHHMRAFEPYGKLNILDAFFAHVLSELFNWTIPNALETGIVKISIPFYLDVEEAIPGLKGTEDFFGINYYTREYVEFNLENGELAPVLHYNPDALRSDLNWEIYPKGLEEFLSKIQKRNPGRSILITENGIADADDSRREEFLRVHLKAVLSAIRNGARVENYCYWSLMDNFEWIEGFGPRFGLYEMDYSNLRRIPRKSSKYISDAARANRLPD